MMGFAALNPSYSETYSEPDGIQQYPTDFK
jgi:hypothetical protein